VTTDTSAPLTTGTHGGARRGAGKPIGAPASQNTALVKRSIMENLNIPPEYENLSPLDVLLGAMRHYYAKGALMEAVSCADKAAKYRHAPVSAKQGSVTGDDVEEVTAVSDLPKRRPGRPPIALAA
jgi:hypothetical protein